MKVPIALLCAVLLSSGATAIVVLWDEAPDTADAPDADTTHEPDEHAHAHRRDHADALPDVNALTGEVPTLTDAMTTLKRRDAIVIRSDRDFNPANGVVDGRGTPADPYVIEGWFVDVVHIADTSAWFVFRENYVNDILILDWNGPGAIVHHNHLEDLRTNRNVARTGDATGGILAHNDIRRVEQLRHYDGEMAHNTIGERERPSLLAERVVFDIAGFNGADIHHNEIWGGVDMKLHGHHHSGGYDHGHSHNHGQADGAQNETWTENHTDRWVSLDFHHNVIHDDNFGMRWNDLNHAGDDRQAASEQEPTLELPHVHHTDIRLRNNTIEGSTLRVTVFNAPDELHLANRDSRLIVENNTLVEPVAGNALIVQDVRDALVVVRNNEVKREGLRLAGTSAIFLQRFQNATVLVEDNGLTGYRYGIRAHAFDAATNWTVLGNTARGADHDVYWDSSVHNPPRGASDDAAQAEDDHDHDHGDAPAAPPRRMGCAASESVWAGSPPGGSSTIASKDC